MKRIIFIMIVVIAVLSFSLSSCFNYTYITSNDQKLNPPINPFPANETTGVATDLTLRWECENPRKTNLTYDVYLSTNKWSLTKIAEDITERQLKVTGLEYQTDYYWRIEAKASETTESRESAISEQWTFQTMVRPYIELTAPENPTPEDGQTGVSTTVTLSWEQENPDERELCYNVYFGQTSGDLEKIAEDLTVTELEQSGLEYNTTYYWRVEAYDVLGDGSLSPREIASGDEWEFTTMEEPYIPPQAPTNPTPDDGQTGVATELTLSWEQSNPDGRIFTYDVYFGQTSGDLEKIAEDLTVTELEQSGLEYNTTYYWRVEVSDEHESASKASGTYTGSKKSLSQAPIQTQYGVFPEGKTRQGDRLLSPRTIVSSEEWQFTTQSEPVDDDFSYDLFINGVNSLPIDTVQFNIVIWDLEEPVNRLILSGNGVDRELTVIDNHAEITDYLVEKGSTTVIVKGYDGEHLRWEKAIALPQSMEVIDIETDYISPLYYSYRITLRINYNAITKIEDFTSLNEGTFLHFRTTDDELLDFVPVEFIGDATSTTCTFKLFVEDETTTNGTLETDSAAYLELFLNE